MILTVDWETKDPYLSKKEKRKTGAGWVYAYNNIPGQDFRLLGFALKVDDNPSIYSRDYGHLKELVGKADVIVMHNAAYDLGCLLVAGVDFKDKVVVDTMLCGKLYDNQLDSYSLEALAERFTEVRKGKGTLAQSVFDCDIYPWLEKDKTAKKRAEKKGEEYRRPWPEGDKVVNWVNENMDVIQEHRYDLIEAYACADTDATYALYKFFEGNLDMDIARYYGEIVKMTTLQRAKGVRVSIKNIQEARSKSVPLVKRLFEELYEKAGREFNINAPADIAALFDEKKIKYKKTALGSPSFTKKWLSSQEHPLCKAIVEAREAQKLDKDFLKSLLDLQYYTCPNATEYGRVFPEFQVLGAATGRFTCKNPNCFDKYTEVLTDHGFRLFKDLDKSEKIAQYMPEHNEVEFVKPLAYVEHYSEYINHISTNKGIDLSVTDDHRLLLLTRNNKAVVTNAINYKEDYKQIAAGVLKDKLNINSKTLHLIFAIQADGYLTKYGVDFTFVRGRKIEIFESYIGKLKQYKEGRYRTLLKYKDIPDLVWRYIDKETKEFTSNLWELAREDILNFLMVWDGDSVRFSEWKSKSIVSANRVQEMLCLSNVRTNRYIHKVGGKHFYVVRACKRNYYFTTNRTVKREVYNDKVYCVTVPSSFIIVRRNGRVAITGNCQQIPAADTPLGKLCRSVFVPEEGKKWYSLDYSSQESRLQVHYANLLKCEGAELLALEFKNNPNLDLHELVAGIAGITRKEAKTINLGMSYGMGLAKLGASLEITDEQAGLLRDKYNQLSPYLNQLSQHAKNAMKKRGRIKTLGGRLVKVDAPAMVNGNIKDFDYKALNYLIQGSASDQTLRAMYLSWKAGIDVMFSVHDELCISGDLTDAQTCAKLMESAFELTVPVVAEFNQEGADNWGEAK